MCQVNGFTNHLLSSASLLGLFVISTDRYISIFYPLTYHEHMTTKRAVFVISCAWGYALITAVLPVIGWSRYTFAKGIWLCVTDFKNSISFSYFIILTIYGVPLTMMSVIYYRIFKIAFYHAKAIEQQACVNRRPNDFKKYPVINKWLVVVTDVKEDSVSIGMETLHSRKLSTSGLGSRRPSRLTPVGDIKHADTAGYGSDQPSDQKGSTQVRKERKKLLIIKKEIRTGLVLSVIVLIFVLSWSPFAILNLWALHTGKRTSPTSEAIVSRLAYANSAINPPLYCLMNKIIRKSMHKLWYRLFKILRINGLFRCKKPEDNEVTVY